MKFTHCLKLVPTTLLAALSVGCGGSQPQIAANFIPPHGGNIMALPDGKGLVEIVRAAPTAKAKSTKPEITFYFFGPDKAKLAEMPSAATLMVQTAKGPKTVELTPQGDGLATPGDQVLIGTRDLEGELNVTIGGKSVKLPLNGR